MFSWRKKGLVFQTSRRSVGRWMKNSALTPTPYRINDDVIRVYAGFRDDVGVSRIGYVDVMANDPTVILDVSKQPVLDIGRDGCFDDNGIILGDIIESPDGLYMFYVGFQLVAKAKFLAFTGLAKSLDFGSTFVRVSESPIVDRSLRQTTIGAVHSVIFDKGKWRIWYASGDGWEHINGVPYPQYHICYVETENLLDIPRRGEICLVPQGEEYRIGRPRVYRANGKYIMYYTKGTVSGGYFPGVAYSEDGVTWVRKDEELGIALSGEGWDSQTICYPAVIQHKDSILMFYNGNGMGVDGFGVAETIGCLQ